MVSWSLRVDFLDDAHSFPICPTTGYHDLIQVVFNYFQLNTNDYLLEIHDPHFQRYIVVNEEYLTNIPRRLRTDNKTVLILHGRIIRQPSRPKTPANDDTLRSVKRQKTLSSSLKYSYLIIWLDLSIEHYAKYRPVLHKLITTTMLNVSRPMLDFEQCIDDLIQINSKKNKNKSHFIIFNNKDDCLACITRTESTVSIIFIMSAENNLSSYGWALDYGSKILIFDSSLCLLVRLVRDLAQSFVDKAEITSTSSLTTATNLLKWARELYGRASRIEDPIGCHIRYFIDHRLETLEQNWSIDTSDKVAVIQNDDKFALECDDA